MESETRELVYLSVSLMLLAIVLSFVVFGLNMMHQVATIRNTEIQSNEAIEQYRKFNAYDGQTLGGDDVIECLRMLYDSGATLFVDYRENKSTHQVVDDTHNRVCSYCQHTGDWDHRFYNLEMYLDHKNAPSENNYFAIFPDLLSSERDDMRNWYASTSKYRCYLVYNSEDILDYYNELIDNFHAHSNPSDTEEDKLLALDSGIHNAAAGAVVTGVIMISYETLGIS